MTIDEKIEILDIVSDIFFEISRHFETQAEISSGNRLLGVFEVEKKRDTIIDYYTNPPAWMDKNDKNILKFRILNKIVLINDWKDEKRIKYIKKISPIILNRLPYLEKRLSSFLPEYNIKFTQNFVLLGFQNGLVRLPLFEKDKNNIDKEDVDRMVSSGYYSISSYEKNIKDINYNDNIQIGYVYIWFQISKKSSEKEKDTESKESKFNRFIKKFNRFIN